MGARTCGWALAPRHAEDSVPARLHCVKKSAHWQAGAPPWLELFQERGDKGDDLLHIEGFAHEHAAIHAAHAEVERG